MVNKRISIKLLPIQFHIVVLESLEDDFADYRKINQTAGMVLAATHSFNNGHIAIILDLHDRKSITIGGVIHELEHVVDYIEGYVDQKYQCLSEYRAYLLGYVSQVTMTTLLDHGYVIKKIKGEYKWTKD